MTMPNILLAGAGERSRNCDPYRNLSGPVRRCLGQKAIGEPSHSYLYEVGAAAEIRRYVPEAKLVAILRNPIDRAYSHFLHMVRSGTEPLDNFAQALQEEVGIHKERTFRITSGENSTTII